MTRASRKIKLEDDTIIERPTRREVDSSHGPLVAELLDRMLTLRPKGARAGGPAEISVTFGQIYQRAMEDRVLAKLREKQRQRRKARRPR